MFNPNVDKSSGNYLHFKITSPQPSTVTISYPHYPAASITFETVASTKPINYLVRVSSQWDWVHFPINEISVKTSRVIVINEFLIRKGD